MGMSVAITPPPADRPLVRLDPGNPQELLGLIPYLIGFRPDESFVLLLFTDRRLLLSARLDLAPAGQAASLAGYCRSLATAHGATGAVAVVFSDRFDAAVELLDRWSAAWSRSGSGPRGGRRRRRRDPCPLFDALYADGRRWWSRRAAPGRDRDEGHPYDPRASNTAATAVLAGLPALSSRAELERRVAGPPDPDRPALAALAARTVRDLDPLDRPARQSLLTAMIMDLLADGADSDGSGSDGSGSDGQGSSDDHCARLAVLAADVTIRDVAWSMITTERADDHTDLWSRVARRTIDRYALGPLGLAGFAAWISGQGALMNCCIERAESIDPGYRMIELLSEIGRRGVPPAVWRELGPAIRQGVGLVT